MRIIQIILYKLNQWFLCWHAWSRLKHHDLPNEPYLDECIKCGHIANRFK